MNRPERLDVFLDTELVGSVKDTSPLAFHYSPTWLTRSQPLPIAAIPLTPDEQQSPAVQAFFENLLPEGDLRHYISEQKKASTLFSMLLEVAGDTAGAFIILPAGQTPKPARYEATSWEALAAQLGKSASAAIDIKGKNARISLAGAQDKASIAIFDDGIPRLPRGTAPSTHILKPDIKRVAKVWHSAMNEAIVMRVAAHCGLPTAEVFYESRTQSSVVRRFDRILHPDGAVQRLIQYDMCQLAGIVSEKKYENEGGPGISACAAIIRSNSIRPASDLRNFLSWIIFNLFVGNNDSHAKNLSMYRVPGEGMMLTPFYDLMCTRIYPGLSRQFAFSIGGETRPGSIKREHLDAMAKQLHMQPRLMQELAAELAARIPDAVERAQRELASEGPPGARELADRLKNFILSTTKKTSERIAHQ